MNLQEKKPNKKNGVFFPSISCPMDVKLKYKVQEISSAYLFLIPGSQSQKYHGRCALRVPLFTGRFCHFLSIRKCRQYGRLSIGSARNQISCTGRSNQVNRLFSEVRFRELQEAGRQLWESPCSNTYLFKERNALKEFLVLEFTVYFMCLLSII